jgi:hypothetical protein
MSRIATLRGSTQCLFRPTKEDNMGVNAEIRIFITGGTFDKEYDELTGRLYFKDSHVP